MTQLTLLEEIRDANERFLAGEARFLDSAGDPFVVLACIDPRLTGFLEPAMGLPRHRATVVRAAGNRISEKSYDALRSIAAGVYLKGAREVLVVGHTDCALSKFSASEIAENFRKAGVPRSAFGQEDLRAWFGAFADIRGNVFEGVEFLRRSAFLPAGVKIHGLILDTESGKIEVILDGDRPEPAAPAPPSQPFLPESPRPTLEKTPVLAGAVLEEIHPPPLPASGWDKSPVIASGSIQQAPKVAVPATISDAVMVFRDFVVRERHNKKLERNVSELRALLKREKNPAGILKALEKSVKDYQREYPNLPAALAFCKKALEEKGTAGLRFTELMKRFLD